jgi:hypothetical protein
VPAQPVPPPPPPTRRRARAPAAAALVLVLLAVAAITLVRTLGDDGADEAPPLARTPLPAEGLADSIGVALHLNYVDTAYVNRDAVVARLRELGIEHVRSPMPTPPVGALADGLRALRSAGIRATLTTGDPNVPPTRAVADSLAVMDGAIDAFEGPNEPDHAGDPAWAPKLRTYMTALRRAVGDQAPGVPLIGPSLVEPGNRRAAGRLPGLVNLHPYPGGEPPEPVLGEALAGVAGEVRRGVVFTETGYHDALNDPDAHAPVSEEAAAVYLPRLVVAAFGAGVRRTFIYELLDEKPEPARSDLQQHFGLLRNDLTPKPAFHALKALIAVLRSAGDGEPSRRRRALHWDLRVDDDVPVQRLELVRRDGSHLVALWRTVPVWDRDRRRPVEVTPATAELSFRRTAREVAVWRPSRSAGPVLRRPAARGVRLELGGDLVVVGAR